MVVNIKGMEMPKNCASCDIACWHYLDFGADGLLSKVCRTESRRPDCPLVPVPKHGRLIDADALEIDAQKRMLLCDKHNNQFQKPYEIMRAIALSPTIIPAEEGKT